MLQKSESATDALSDWLFEGPMTAAQRERLEEHPGFPAAARQLIMNMASLRHVNAALLRMVKDAGHYVAAMVAIHLHVSGGLTMKRLREFCGSTNYLSPGRARALMIYMQYLGFVELLPTKRGQIAYYLPTTAFLRSWRHHLRLALEATVPIVPEMETLLMRFDEDEVFELFTSLHCDSLMQAAAVPGMRSEELERVFLHRVAGQHIVHALLNADVALAAKEGHAISDGTIIPDEQPVPVSIAALAREFKVSRLHVSRMLDDAETAGLLRRTIDGSVIWLETGREELIRSFSSQLVCLIRAAADTADRIGLETSAVSEESQIRPGFAFTADRAVKHDALAGCGRIRFWLDNFGGGAKIRRFRVFG